MKFLINTITRWEEPPRARHQVAYALSKKHMVVFVAANKHGLPRIKSIIINDNLVVLMPYFLFGYKIRYRIPIINEVYQYWLYHKLAKKYNDYKVINFDYTATKIYNYFNDVIYYCNDSFAAISKNINLAIIARYHLSCESKVAAKAKFCIAVSAILRDNLKKINKNSFEIPLGSPNIDDYDIVINSVPVRNKIFNIGLVGYIGTSNISFNIVNQLINEDNIRVILVGPVEDKFRDSIEQKENLIFKGILKGRELYNEINKFDVAIAPYASRLANDDALGVGTGSKIYHYLALGKPVVISNMIGLSKINIPDKFIYIANSDMDFISSIYKAHDENTEELIQQRINYAKDNTWDKRMENLIEYYQKN